MNIGFLGIGFCAVIMLAGACRIQEHRSKEEDLSEIHELHETDWAASKAHDIETLRTLWTEDAVLLPQGQEPIIGDEAIWAFMKAQQPEMMMYDILEYTHEFEEIEIIGDWAYEWGTFYGTYRPVGGDEILKERSRLFRVLRRVEGSWKVARAMWHALPSDGEERERR